MFACFLIFLSLKQSTIFSGASTIRLRLHGSGLIYEKTKLLTDPSFVYAGTAEPWTFLNGKVCNFWPDQKKVKTDDQTVPLLRGPLLTVQSFCTVCAVKAPLVSDVSRSADLRLWLQKELNISQKCCCSCCLQTPCRNFSWKFLWYFSINFLLSSSHFAFTVSQSTLSPSISVYSPQGRGVAILRQ